MQVCASVCECAWAFKDINLVLGLTQWSAILKCLLYYYYFLILLVTVMLISQENKNGHPLFGPDLSLMRKSLFPFGTTYT